MKNMLSLILLMFFSGVLFCQSRPLTTADTLYIPHFSIDDDDLVDMAKTLSGKTTVSTDDRKKVANRLRYARQQFIKALEGICPANFVAGTDQELENIYREYKRKGSRTQIPKPRYSNANCFTDIKVSINPYDGNVNISGRVIDFSSNYLSPTGDVDIAIGKFKNPLLKEDMQRLAKELFPPSKTTTNPRTGATKKTTPYSILHNNYMKAKREIVHKYNAKEYKNACELAPRIADLHYQILTLPRSKMTQNDRTQRKMNFIDNINQNQFIEKIHEAILECDPELLSIRNAKEKDYAIKVKQFKSRQEQLLQKEIALPRTLDIDDYLSDFESVIDFGIEVIAEGVELINERKSKDQTAKGIVVLSREALTRVLINAIAIRNELHKNRLIDDKTRDRMDEIISQSRFKVDNLCKKYKSACP